MSKDNWVAQSVECPTLGFSSGHDLGVLRWSPTHIRLHAWHGVFFFFFLSFYLFIHERHTERQRPRQREKQAPCREPDAGPDPWTRIQALS